MSFRGRCTVFAAVAAAFALLPASFIDAGPTICLFKLLTGRECWGCGTLRAFSCIMHLDLSKAWQQNHLILVTAPLITLLSLHWLIGRDIPGKTGLTGEAHEDCIDR
jgi:hypothetical protein